MTDDNDSSSAADSDGNSSNALQHDHHIDDPHPGGGQSTLDSIFRSIFSLSNFRQCISEDDRQVESSRSQARSEEIRKSCPELVDSKNEKSIADVAQRSTWTDPLDDFNRNLMMSNGQISEAVVDDIAHTFLDRYTMHLMKAENARTRDANIDRCIHPPGSNLRIR